MQTKLAIAAVACVLGLTPLAHAATVFSDDFSSDTAGGNLTSLNNWSVTSGNVDVIGDGYYPMYSLANKLDMNGNTPGRIEHAFANLAAGLYTLTFDYGNNMGSNNQEQLSFGIGGLLANISIPGAVANLLSQSYSFVWGGGATSLFFADTGTSNTDSGGPILSNVSLSAVPLPAGAPLLLAGVAGLVALRRRRKSV
ncbi:MAG: VPLPA-CTERM sorting domain-containing protein [Cypionkella sp.]